LLTTRINKIFMNKKWQEDGLQRNNSWQRELGEYIPFCQVADQAICISSLSYSHVMAIKLNFLYKSERCWKRKSDLTNLNEWGRYDKTVLKLFMMCVTELYHAFQEFNDEFILLDPTMITKMNLRVCRIDITR